MQHKFSIVSDMKKLITFTLLSLISIAGFSQDNGDDPEQSKFFGGGNFGLAFGRFTLINLNPQVGYRFNRFVGAGLGVNLVYTSLKERDPLTRQDYRKVVQGITGLNTFVRLYPTERFLLQVQPEANYIFGKEIFYQPERVSYKLDAEIIPSVLMGGGLVTPAGKGTMLFTVMYDVLQNPGSPYGNRPIVNFGYNFNF